MTTSAPAGAPRPLHRNLGFRLAVALALGTGAILLLAMTLNLRLHRASLTRLMETQAAEIVEVVRGSTREAMLHNNAAELRRMIDTLAAQDEIDRIRVFDKQGRITQSSVPQEVGGLVDRTAEQCVSCHAADRPLDHLDLPARSRIFNRPGAGRVLAMIAPIRNETSCATAACHAHPPAQTILGVLDVQLPLTRVDASLAAAQRQLLIGLAASAAAVLVFTWWLAWRMVLRRAVRLTAAAPRLAAGDFAARVPEGSADELGDLARAWNRMASELGQAHDELAAWGQKLAARVDEKTAELERTHQRLLRVEKMASLGKLASSVAHELNNPLAGIATYAKLLRRRAAEPRAAPPPAEDAERILRLIEEEAMRCGNIVRNLLLFSRTPGARFAAEDLAPIVERCAMLVRHSFDLQNVELRTELPPGLPVLECDAAQVQQMLLALIINGLEATAAGGWVTVSATAEEEPGRMRVRVADSGRGIAPEMMDKIFEPFFTTKEATSGCGLGLAVVYGIVERHAARIDVASTPGAGTVFTIDFPLRQSPAAAERPEAGS
jgi:two-component system NtrC family sensor kinase